MTSTASTCAAYESDGIRLYHGDVRELLSSIEMQPTVLLSDPPYAAHKYLRITDETGELNPDTDMRWSGAVFKWVGEWFWQVRLRMAPEGVAWLFVNTHYFGFYLRWAKYARWPVRGIFACPPDEFILALGPEPLAAPVGRDIMQACQLNTYGQNKPLALLRALVRASPEGLVLDPFAGLGSTLEAARLEGRPAVGVEIKRESVEQTIASWQK